MRVIGISEDGLPPQMTRVDRSVRSTEELDPSRFKLHNTAAWDAFIEQHVKKIREKFALQQKIEARLYKLLVYKTGGHFKMHSDTEKEPGSMSSDKIMNK